MPETNAVPNQANLLFKKSQENYACAIKAKEMAYCNVSVSRLYYCCLLLLKRCLIESGICSEQEIRSSRGASHDFIINKYINDLLPTFQVSYADTASIRNIRTLKDHRKVADYSPEVDFSSPEGQKRFEKSVQIAEKWLRAVETIHKLKIR